VERVAEELEQGGGTVQDLRVNAMEVVQWGDVAHNPDLITVQEHNFSCLFV
jgi:hypothetical protein